MNNYGQRKLSMNEFGSINDFALRQSMNNFRADLQGPTAQTDRGINRDFASEFHGGVRRNSMSSNIKIEEYHHIKEGFQKSPMGQANIEQVMLQKKLFETKNIGQDLQKLQSRISDVLQGMSKIDNKIQKWDESHGNSLAATSRNHLPAHAIDGSRNSGVISKDSLRNIDSAENRYAKPVPIFPLGTHQSGQENVLNKPPNLPIASLPFSDVNKIVQNQSSTTRNAPSTHFGANSHREERRVKVVPDPNVNYFPNQMKSPENHIHHASQSQGQFYNYVAGEPTQAKDAIKIFHAGNSQSAQPAYQVLPDRLSSNTMQRGRMFSFNQNNQIDAFRYSREKLDKIVSNIEEQQKNSIQEITSPNNNNRGVYSIVSAAGPPTNSNLMTAENFMKHQRAKSVNFPNKFTSNLMNNYPPSTNQGVPIIITKPLACVSPNNGSQAYHFPEKKLERKETQQKTVDWNKETHKQKNDTIFSTYQMLTEDFGGRKNTFVSREEDVDKLLKLLEFCESPQNNHPKQVDPKKNNPELKNQENRADNFCGEINDDIDSLVERLNTSRAFLKQNSLLESDPDKSLITLLIKIIQNSTSDKTVLNQKEEKARIKKILQEIERKLLLEQQRETARREEALLNSISELESPKKLLGKISANQAKKENDQRGVVVRERSQEKRRVSQERITNLNGVADIARMRAQVTRPLRASNGFENKIQIQDMKGSDVARSHVNLKQELYNMQGQNLNIGKENGDNRLKKKY